LAINDRNNGAALCALDRQGGARQGPSRPDPRLDSEHNLTEGFHEPLADHCVIGQTTRQRGPPQGLEASPVFRFVPRYNSGSGGKGAVFGKSIGRREFRIDGPAGEQTS